MAKLKYVNFEHDSFIGGRNNSLKLITCNYLKNLKR